MERQRVRLQLPGVRSLYPYVGCPLRARPSAGPAELCSPPVLRLPHPHPSAPRFESHIWESKKQIYLGGFDTEALAAKAHGERLASTLSGGWPWPISGLGLG